MTEAAVRRVGVIGVGRMGLPMARHTAAAGFQVKVFDIDPAACRKAELAVYYAYIDRAPVFIIGATGPMDETKRRPHIDWAHTANVQGEAVRHYTKWDYQPAVIGGVPESFERAYSVMMTEPQGPIYMCYDAWLQEQPLTEEVPLAPAEAVKVPALMAPDPTALAAVAERLLAAERPVLLADYVGRQHQGFHDLVALAETLGAPVFDINNRLNFPSRHPLNLSLDKTVFADADLIAMLDVSDWEQATSELDSTNRVVTSVVPETCEWIDIGFAELGISKWSMDYRRLQHCSHRVLADTALAIPQLTALCQARVAEDQGLAKKIEDRSRSVAERHQALRASWAEEARRDWDASPLTLPRLASEVWDAVQDKDWVLSAGTLRGWARRLWDLNQPYRHPGKSLGTATQIGISLGVALAHKGSGRLVIDLQPDGDLMFDLGALWFAAKHEIPLLVVMFNNRAYYNDWEHQIRMARQRGTPEARAHIGMDLFGPNPDFAAVARAIAQVEAGKPALIDTVTQHR